MKDAYKNTLLNAIYGLLLVIVISAFYNYSEMLWIIVMVISLLVLKNNNIRHAPLYWIIGGTVFPMVESICVYFGAWAYTVPNIFNVPLWLFPAWAAVVVMIRKCNSEIFLDMETRLKKWITQ